MPDMTPGQAAGYVHDQLVDLAGTGLSEEDIDRLVSTVLDRFFLAGYPDVAAEMWRRAGVPEEQVFEAVMAAADRLDRDRDLVGELVFGDD